MFHSTRHQQNPPSNRIAKKFEICTQLNTIKNSDDSESKIIQFNPILYYLCADDNNNNNNNNNCSPSGQTSWLQIKRSRFRFPLLQHFLRNCGPGTGSPQPREEPRWTAVGIRCADHAPLFTGKIRHYFGGRSGRTVGILHLRIKRDGVCFCFIISPQISELK
jgi:hypothetical protein